MVWYIVEKLNILTSTQEPVGENYYMENTSPYLELSKFLRSSHAFATPNIFSSDNSQLCCYLYGVDIYDLIKIVKVCADSLLLDEKINFDTILAIRKADFIRQIFIGRAGDFPDIEKTLLELRRHALRLTEGLELRNRNIDLGVHTLQNLAAATFVFKDIEAFYSELYHEYRIQCGRSGSTDNRGSR